MSIAMQSNLQDWDTDDENSKRPQRKKRKREPSDEGDVRLPKWCRYVEEPLRRKMLKQEKESIMEVMKREKQWRSIIGRVFPPPCTDTRTFVTFRGWLYNRIGRKVSNLLNFWLS